jgi:uncharacterized protein (TIGR03435 family)
MPLAFQCDSRKAAINPKWPSAAGAGCPLHDGTHTDLPIDSLSCQSIERRSDRTSARHRLLEAIEEFLLTKLKLCVAAFAMLMGVSPMFTPSGRAQSLASNTNPAAPVFEVATIRPNDSDGMMHTVHIDFEQERFSASNCSLELMLQVAYGVDAQQITGVPKWIRSANYDVEAKMDLATFDQLSKLDDEQRDAKQRLMLQALLMDRFKLTLHRETKELPIYSLVIARNGPKLQEAKPGDIYANGAHWSGGAPMGPHEVDYRFIAGQVHMQGQAASVKDLTDRLTQKFAEQLGRKIVDNTGLTGNYDFELNFKVPWPPEGSQTLFRDPEGSQGTDNGTATESSEVSLFAAIQEQLGLKLQSAKGPVEFIVIDHVESPSDN